MLPLHPSQYQDTDIHNQECKDIFEHSWLLVAHTSEFRDNNTQISRRIANIPIVVWKTIDGYLAYINSCKHRGGPLVWDNTTQISPSLRCKYHGWTYNTDGILTHTPNFGASCPSLQLQQLSVLIIQDCIFVSVHPPSYDITQLQVWKEIEKLPSNYTLYTKQQHTLACNWKVYAENYLEGYHIPYIHPALSKELQMQSYHVEVEGREIIHKVSTKEEATAQGYWSFVWPNVAVNIYSNGLNIERIIPISATQTCIEYWYFFANREEADSTIHSSATITQEDIDICETVQRNISSGFHHPGPLSPKHENGVMAFQQWVMDAGQKS